MNELTYVTPHRRPIDRIAIPNDRVDELIETRQ